MAVSMPIRSKIWMLLYRSRLARTKGREVHNIPEREKSSEDKLVAGGGVRFTVIFQTFFVIDKHSYL